MRALAQERKKWQGLRLGWVVGEQREILGLCLLVSEQSDIRFHWRQNDRGVWTEAPHFPVWIFPSLLYWSSDSSGDAIGCLSQADAAAAAWCLRSSSVVRHREREREKRRPFDILISNGSVCMENEEAQKNAWKERGGFLEIHSHPNMTSEVTLFKLFVCHVFTQRAFLVFNSWPEGCSVKSLSCP